MSAQLDDSMRPSLVYDQVLDQVYPDKVLDQVYMTLVVNQPRAL